MHAAKPSSTNYRKKSDNSSGFQQEQRQTEIPLGVCKLFNKGTCTHLGDKHGAPWNSNFVLKHVCAKFVTAKNGFCLEPHAEKDHK